MMILMFDIFVQIFVVLMMILFLHSNLFCQCHYEVLFAPLRRTMMSMTSRIVFQNISEQCQSVAAAPVSPSFVVRSIRCVVSRIPLKKTDEMLPMIMAKQVMTTMKKL